MANRIEAALKEGVRDARGERIKREIEHFLHLEVEEVRTLDVYTLDMDLSAAELERAASGPFSDPVIQLWSIDRPLAAGFDFALSKICRAVSLSSSTPVKITLMPFEARISHRRAMCSMGHVFVCHLGDAAILIPTMFSQFPSHSESSNS